MFEAFAREQPLVVIIDELQWAEPTLLDLLEYLLTFAADQPILLLCLTRPDLFDERPSWSAPGSGAIVVWLEPLDSEAESGSIPASVLRIARGRLRVEQGRVAEGLEDFLAVGARLTSGMVTCPGFLPWRSYAALAHLALDEHESARRLSDEELELARAFGTPRALGVATRAAGVIAGGDRGASLLRVAIDAFERGDARLERARAAADLGAMLRRRNRRTEARELLREASPSSSATSSAPRRSASGSTRSPCGEP